MIKERIFGSSVAGEVHRQAVLYVRGDVHRSDRVLGFEGAPVVHYGISFFDLYRASLVLVYCSTKIPSGSLWYLLYILEHHLFIFNQKHHVFHNRARALFAFFTFALFPQFHATIMAFLLVYRSSILPTRTTQATITPCYE